MSDSKGIQFSRTPYRVTYRDLQGQMQTIQRVPPPKLHEALPTDVVVLTSGKSEVFPEGKEVTVKSINPRQPNTLQVVDSKGNTTFVEYYGMKLKKQVNEERPGVEARELPINNRYLNWP